MIRYRNIIMDSARWDGFEFRDDDIVISTPPKCGTTWTQMICALLIFQAPDLQQPLDTISPWLDQLVADRDAVLAMLAGQTHRRFIKSHTPLDGLPWDDRVTYVCVGRDPRDMAVSMDNHMQNMDLMKFLALREAAVGLEDLAEVMPDGPPPMPPESAVERFWEWIDSPDVLRGLPSALHHLDTFWQAKARPNVVLLHYADLKADLEGEMRRLADRLDIDVPDDRWPALAHAASFDEMRSRAPQTAPNATDSIWYDPARFFSSGTSGQWRRLLDEDGLRRYEEVAARTCSAELSAWLHRG